MNVPIHERHCNLSTIIISAGERKGRTIGLKYMAWYSVHLLKPHDNAHNMAAQNRKRIGLIITNSQNMYICKNSLFYSI